MFLSTTLPYQKIGNLWLLALFPAFLGDGDETDWLTFIFVMVILLTVVVTTDAVGVFLRPLDRSISVFNVSSTYVAIILGVLVTGVDYSFNFQNLV